MARINRFHVRTLAGAVLLALCFVITGCHTLKPESFAGAEPRFDPDKYFEGPTRSWGVTESRSGRPKSRFRTEMMGRREGGDKGDLVITQDFHFEDGRTQQRVWHIHRAGDHRYEASASDVIGPAVGYAYGNTFHWEYTLALRPGNKLANVHMEHWMYLQADGETMINRVLIRKFGVIVAETTEHFHRGSGPVPSIGRDSPG
jgi:hypothetical protein